jgi:hypothetical protein
MGYVAWTIIVLAIVAFNKQAIQFLRAGDAGVIGSENGPLENAQLLMMVPALALFWFAALRGRGAVGVAGVLLAMMGTIIFIREIDFATLSGALWFDWLVAHGLQDGLFVLLGCATLLYLLWRRRHFWGVVRLGFRWQAWPSVAAIGLLALAEFYLDDFSGPTGHFWEELVETNGYFLLVVAAWKHSSLIGDPELDSPL